MVDLVGVGHAHDALPPAPSGRLTGVAGPFLMMIPVYRVSNTAGCGGADMMSEGIREELEG